MDLGKKDAVITNLNDIFRLMLLIYGGKIQNNVFQNLCGYFKGFHNFKFDRKCIFATGLEN